ncbi:MAG: NADH-quinone oxidoreductase subunit C [Bacteroidales bacterium]|nr:NADH-quinone oxidoreductase subunit C [Bacteroidales bacterium]
MSYITISNNQSVPSGTIPVMEYSQFLDMMIALTDNHPERHCVLYFGYREKDSVHLICCIADDLQHTIMISSSEVKQESELNSFSARNLSFEKFEREIHENFGIGYTDHPWLKPVRYPENRADRSSVISGYPFFSIGSEELHEVGVGPVHAGIIEPGHFRFVCNGEQILHLEIQLGYQHRGVEQLFLDRKKLIERTTLAESIAGDSVIGHTTAFSYLWESLGGIVQDEETLFSRTLAQEIERIAIHTGDLSGICTDVAYQLGSSVFGRLRTPIINFFQEWCGNRLSKGLIRAGYNPFPFNRELAGRLIEILDAFEPDFIEMCADISRLPSTLSRFERTGMLKYEQLLSIGTVGMSARMHTLDRDIRASHPYGIYSSLNHIPVIKHHGDVYSRVQIRKEEVLQSIGYIRTMLKKIPESATSGRIDPVLKPSTFGISLTEGWRGEICHAAITDENGELLIYKVKDPSFHNWLALALAVRNNEISDFPVSNKSFDLSYCGHDL